MMKVIDISRELFSAPVYPGDPKPSRDIVRRIDMGDAFNLSAFYACCHSGTHMDAPLHFFDGGDSIDRIPPKTCIGPCRVVKASGLITGADIDTLSPTAGDRILFQGNGQAFLTQSAAFALAQAKVILVGTDAQSIAIPEDETEPHRELLGAGIPVLEGLDLSSVCAGNYLLAALPLFLGGAEAAPVRAVLIEQ